jgi:hypothetical protein
MTSEASTTTWETLVEQYRERAARDDARIEELRQRTEHWHDTADMLKRQRDMAEQERDEWKRKYLDEAGAHDKTRRAWGEEAADMTRNAMRDGSEFGSLLSERDALRAERDALRKDAARYRLLRGLFRHAKWADVDALHELEPDGEKYIADDLLDAALDCVIDAAMEAKV